MPNIILASTSRYRRDLLQRLQLDFVTRAPQIEERVIPGELPEAMALRLAREKAHRVAESIPGAIVIGADQVAAIDGRILRKPGTPERALEQLQAMRGRVHTLNTAIHLVNTETAQERSHVDVARLWLRADLSDTELRTYIAHDRPLDCAGGYKLESRGIALFARIECDDWNAIIGLPLIALVDILREFGVALF